MDLPDPVGPVTRTRPRGKSANWRTARGYAQLLERHDLKGDGPEHSAHRVPLLEHVEPEPANAGYDMGSVKLQRRLEALPDPLRQDLVDEVADLCWVQYLKAFNRLQGPRAPAPWAAAPR